MRKILVTGGAGYVGSHACKALAKVGYKPVVYDNLSTGNRWAVRWGPLEIGDLLDQSRLLDVIKNYQPEAVMHFAGSALVGESTVDPSRYYRNNVLGTLNLLDACRTLGVKRVVFSSTCAVYGEPGVLPIPETASTEPVNPYGASKLAAERIIADFGHAYGMQFAVLRYFNAAGADEEVEIGECRRVETHLIPLAIDAILGYRGPLRVMGADYATADGTAVRDYIHVADLAAAHISALVRLEKAAPSFTANLGTGRGWSVTAVLEEIEEIAGRAVPRIVSPRRAGDPPVLVANPTWAKIHLQFAGPERTLQDILRAAWAWQCSERYKHYRASLEPDQRG